MLKNSKKINVVNLRQKIVALYQQEDRSFSNEELYEMIKQNNEFGHLFEEKKGDINLFKRKIRWYQQTLKHAGIIEKTSERGVWKITNSARLTEVNDGYSLLGFSTEFGIAIISDCRNFFNKINEPIHLILTSPPYPLHVPKKYGNVNETKYVDWLCKTIEPVVALMVPGGSLCINISNDIFLKGLPSRSLYREHLVLALHSRLGLHKMDELIWENPCKPPAPFQWASKKRYQLNVAWEPIYWFTNDPTKIRSDNRRVLKPHTQAHYHFMTKGGVNKKSINSDGAYRKYVGSYSKVTLGKIPKNLITLPHDGHAISRYKKACNSIGLPYHGAMMPIKLVEFLIQFLTEKDDLVVDPFGGAITTGIVAEENGRRWICTEIFKEYVHSGFLRFVMGGYI
jgi:DNA modification methylase